MAKKGKHLPAAQRLKISEGVKRAREARLAKSETTVLRLGKGNGPAAVGQPITEFVLHGPGGGGGGSTPRSSKDEYATASERLAIDIVELVVRDVEPTTLVRVVERILRP